MKRKVNTKGSPTCSSSKAVKVPRLDSLSQINLNAAGLDVGDREIYACVPSGRTEQSVRVFPTFTADLNALAQWLRECQITRDFQKINYSFSRIIIILGVWEVGIDGCPLLPIL
jgi:hypothetical protein